MKTMKTKSKSVGVRCATCLGVAALVVTGCVGAIDTRVEYETLSESQPLNGIEELEVDLDFGIGNLEVSQSFEVDELYSLDLEYDRLHYEPELEFRSAGSTGTLRFDLESTGGFPFGDNDNDLVLRLAPGVLVEMEMSTGVGQSFLDFTGLQVRSLRLEAGVGRTELNFESPQDEPMSVIDLEIGVGEVRVRGLGNTRVRDFRFEGGVGGAEVDFTGEWGDGETRADFEVGVGELRLLIPEELAVSIQTDDNFLSNVRAPEFERRGDRYTRNITGEDRPRVMIRIEAGLGEIRLDIR